VVTIWQGINPRRLTGLRNGPPAVPHASLRGFARRLLDDNEGHGERAGCLRRARLTQDGVSVEGSMQCKFAAAHPMSIRGLVLDGNLSPLGEDGQSLEGAGRWYSADGSAESEAYAPMEANGR
jgi:hypothetical protein